MTYSREDIRAVAEDMWKDFYGKMDVLVDVVKEQNELLLAILESLTPEQRIRIAKKIGARFS